MDTPQKSPSLHDFKKDKPEEKKTEEKKQPIEVQLAKDLPFGKIFSSLTKGLKAKRAVWPKGYFLEIINETLVLYKPDTKQYHPLTVKLGDITAKDWIIEQ